MQKNKRDMNMEILEDLLEESEDVLKILHDLSENLDEIEDTLDALEENSLKNKLENAYSQANESFENTIKKFTGLRDQISLEI